ncbi:MAG TPA: Rossmann-like and DUF2520 domain-containing protein [Gemmatimonadaceae bacterium]
MSTTNQPEPVAIVGAGAMGTALAHAFTRAGVPVVAIASRTDEHAEALATRIPGTRRVPLADAGTAAPIVLLTVSDSAIEAACEAIRAGPGVLVAHASGSRDVSALAAARDRGALVGGFHPIAAVIRSHALEAMTTDDHVASFRGAAFGIEGSGEVYTRLAALATALGGRPFAVDPSAKPLYHLGASMLAAFSAGLANMAWERFRAAGAPDDVATAGASHLLFTVARNVGRVPVPAKALTGPAARGDVEGVRRQIRTVRALPEETQALYRVHAEHSVAMALSAGRIDVVTAERLRALLREELPAAAASTANAGRRRPD